MRRSRALRREWRRTTSRAVWTPVRGPAFPLSLLDVGQIGPVGASSAIDIIQDEEDGEGDHDWSEPLMMGV